MTEPKDNEAWRAAYEAGFPNRLPPDHEDYNPEVQRYHEQGFRAGFLARTASPPVAEIGGGELPPFVRALIGPLKERAAAEVIRARDEARANGTAWVKTKMIEADPVAVQFIIDELEKRAALMRRIIRAKADPASPQGTPTNVS
jgi:hypothetical protein